MGNNLSCHVDSILNIFDEREESNNNEPEKIFKEKNLLLSVSSSDSETTEEKESSSRRYYKKEPECVSSILSDFSESIDNKNNFVNFDKSERPEIYGIWNNNDDEVTTTENNDTILSDIEKNQKGGHSRSIKKVGCDCKRKPKPISLHKKSKKTDNTLSV